MGLVWAVRQCHFLDYYGMYICAVVTVSMFFAFTGICVVICVCVLFAYIVVCILCLCVCFVFDEP